MTEKLISTRREFTKELITNDMLKQAAAQLPGKTGNKLHDLAMIFDEFDNKISQKWKDPDGIMSAVADVLRDKEFFKNSAVFIDGFKSFNKQELQIINIIMEECDEVYISISYNQKEDENSPIFADYISMNKTLHRMANRLSARCVDVNLNVEQKRQKNKELQYMAARYWSGRTGSKQIEETPSHIRLFKTKNKYQEAESVAIDILKQIKIDGSKRRWRDFAVVTRNITSYHGIIDAIFDKYNIPYFDAEKIEIGSLSFVRFIMSALEMVERGVYGDNLISYLKSDMCGIEKDDIYIFENYVSKWRISGRKLFEEFVENPRGMVEYFSESDVELLKRLNDIRNRIVVPLISFFTVFRSANTVTEKSRALYNLASTLKKRKKLSQSADEAKKNHDYSKELILRQIWKSFCDVLDIMVTSIGDQDCDVTQFKTYLQALLSDTKIDYPYSDV